MSTDKQSKSQKKSDIDLSVDEDIELDEDVRIDEKSYFGDEVQYYREKPQTIKPTIAGFLLLITFFLNLLLPITFFMLIYDAETATGETSLVGKIKDENNKPVANITVSILNTNLTTKTDDNGKYSLKKVPVKEQEIQFSKEGYVKIKVKKILFSQDLLSRLGESDNIINIPGYLQNGVYVEILDGPYIETKILLGHLNRTIYGHIINQTGSPMSNLQIKIADSDLETRTDSEGNYILTNVTPGIVKLQLSKDPTSRVTTKTLLFASNKSLELNITYNEELDQDFDDVTGKNGSISGRVLDENKQQIRNARILIDLDPDIYPNNLTTTLSDGTYRFENVPVGIYNLTIIENEYKIIKLVNITVVSGENYEVPEQELIRLKSAELYEDEISGAYTCSLVLVILAIITLVGAISAFQRKRYSIAFIGALVSMMPIILVLRLDICVASIFGIISLVMIVFSRDEFGFKKIP